MDLEASGPKMDPKMDPIWTPFRGPNRPQIPLPYKGIWGPSWVTTRMAQMGGPLGLEHDNGPPF